MFGIPAIAKSLPSPHDPPPKLTSSSYSSRKELQHATTINNKNNKSASYDHVEPNKARTLPPTNHTSTDLMANGGPPQLVTGRRRAPLDNPSYPGNSVKSGGVHSVPWAESAPSAPTSSTTQEMYQSAEDRDRNYRKHLRKQFRNYHLEHLIPSTLTCKEGEVDLEQERREDEEEQQKAMSGAPGSTARRFVGKTTLGSFGATDLKLTTIPNTKKKTFHTNRIVPGSNGQKFCPSIDDIGQANEREGNMSSARLGPTRNGNSTSRIHNGNRKVHIKPFLVYEDEVAHLPAVPQVGITYTARDKPEDNSEVIFPWDRPRVGADGAAKLARRENRRLVTQRRLEFAEQFLPEICAGMTSTISKRVAEQYEANRGVAQPLPLSLEPIDDGELRMKSNTTRAGAGAQQQQQQKNKNKHKHSYYRGDDGDRHTRRHHGSVGSPGRKQNERRTSEEERELEKERIREEKRRKAEAIKQKVHDIVEGHSRSLKTHDLIMQVAATSLS